VYAVLGPTGTVRLLLDASLAFVEMFCTRACRIVHSGNCAFFSSKEIEAKIMIVSSIIISVLLSVVLVVVSGGAG
jgi:hypothetical protein